MFCTALLVNTDFLADFTRSQRSGGAAACAKKCGKRHQGWMSSTGWSEGWTIFAALLNGLDTAHLELFDLFAVLIAVRFLKRYPLR